MAFNKKFFAGSFCCYDAKRRGCYDLSGFFKVNEGNTSKTDLMIAYDSPSMTFSNVSPISTMTFNQRMMPDHTLLPYQVGHMIRAGESYLAVMGSERIDIFKTGVLDNVDDVRSGQYYNVFIKDGKPLLSLANDIEGATYYGQFRVPLHTPKTVYKLNCDTYSALFAGNSLNEVSITTGYLPSLYELPNQNVNAYEFDIILRVKTGSNLGGEHILLQLGGFWFGINDNKFAFSCPPSVVNGEAATSSHSYWVRVMQTGFDVLSYTLFYLEDNGTYTFDTLPGIGQWQIGAYGQFISSAAHQTAICLNDAINPWGGAIDLLNCRAYIKYINTLEWIEVWRAINVIN